MIAFVNGAELKLSENGEFVKADMVSEGVVIIDVGINRVDAPETEKGYKLVCVLIPIQTTVTNGYIHRDTVAIHHSVFFGLSKVKYCT